MVSMSDSVSMKTEARGGIMSGLKRKALGGESFFINEFTAAEISGEVTVAPPLPGDVIAVELTGAPLLIQSGSFLAASPEVAIDTKWGGGKMFFSREGLFLLRATGYGTIFLSSFGGIRLVELEEGERYTVDTGHMVAFDETVQYSVGKSGGWKSTLVRRRGASGEADGPGALLHADAQRGRLP